jgi:hypothetical protein
MKRKQISRQADLPAPFDIKLYTPPNDASYWYWVSMLEARVIRRYMATLGDMYKQELIASANFMLQDPQWPSKVRPSVDTGLHGDINATHISEFTIADLCTSVAQIDDSRLDKFKKAWEKSETATTNTEIKEQYEILNIPVWQSYREVGIDDYGEVTLRVNLFGSEEKIVDDFRAWLQRTQKSFELNLPKKRISKIDLENWERFQIIAYLDLTFWAQVNDFEITQNLLGITLFPGEFEVGLAERIRKTVAGRFHSGKVGHNFCYGR